MLRFAIISTIMTTATVVESFSMLPQQNIRSSTRLQADQELSFPIGEPADVDIDRAKDCAENFGKCSMKEVKQLKDDLHNERVRSYVFGNPDQLTQEELIEHRLYEEELNLQLSLLDETNKQQTLFPEVEDEMEELPHLKDGTLQDVVKQEQQAMVMEQLFMDENVVETLAFCSFIALLMVLPQII